MENLSKAFVYFITLAWAATELLILASSGTSWPLGPGFLFFIVAFVVLGCAPLKDSTVEFAGRCFFSICAIACLAFALAGIELSPLGIIKPVAGAALCAIAFRPASRASHHSTASSL